MNKATIYDPTLGELTWNDEDECWVSQIQLNLDHLVNITVDPENAETGAVILQARHYFVQLQEGGEANIRLQTAQQMLPVYQENWSDTENIDIDEFIDRIKLEDIVFYANGTTQLFYDDGGLFAGHGIVVTIDCGGNYQGASLFG